jgi:hypothetical protein
MSPAEIALRRVAAGLETLRALLRDPQPADLAVMGMIVAELSHEAEHGLRRVAPAATGAAGAAHQRRLG